MKKIVKNLEISNSFKIENSKLRIIFGRRSENGIALIIVVSIMAVLASIAAAFSYSMIMDQRAAANYMTGIKADYVARAGIQHAIGVLKKDGDPSNTTGYAYEGYDWYEDDWGYDSTLFGANDNTLNSDSCISNDDNVVSTNAPAAVTGADSRWINLTDSQGSLIGRYAVLVIDESGKININTARYGSSGHEGWTTGEIDIEPVCTLASPDLTSSEARAITNVRYGTDGCAGISGYDDNADSVVLNNDGIDNDGDDDPAGTDGADEGDEGVDDSAEFYIASPYTDSNDLSTDTSYLTPAEVVSLADVTGAEYAKFDSYITTFSSDKNLTDSGLARLNINAVSSAMELYSTLRDAFDYWGTSATTAELAQMAVNIIDYRDRDHGSTRIDIEDGSSTVFTRYGVEGIRINEVMVRPVFRKDGGDAGEETTTVGWTKAGDTWTSSAVDDSGIWSWSSIPDGTYKVKIYGSGNVDYWIYPKVSDSWSVIHTENLSDTSTADTVIISGGVGVFMLNVQANNNDDTWYRVDLSQSPDCEYVELVNISPNAVIMYGWHLEFPNGQVGTIPSGTRIAAMGDSSGEDTIVLAIDMADSTVDNGSEVYNNGIYFTNTYTSANSANVYQLGFTNDVQDDILCDTVLVDSPLRLYDGPIAPTSGNPAGHIVDQVLYDSLIIQNNDFVSMERNDPAYLGTDVLNDSGIFDTWLVSTASPPASLASAGTPTSANNNYSPTNSIKVKNSPFANIGEIADVSYSKTAWTNIGDTEARIKNIADRITVSGRRLDAEFADYTPGASADWTLESLLGDDEETKRKYGGRELNDATDELYWFRANSGGGVTNEDTWTWYTTIDRFEADTYIMYVYGREGGAMRVRVGNDTAIIIPSSDYGARFGQVVIEDTTLNVAVSPEDSDSDSTYFDYILLTPASRTYGRLNINTASVPVLDGLKNIGASTAQDIVNYRNTLTPKAFKSIGEILDVTGSGIGIATFKPISNLITTKSNVFKIICTGQSILDKNDNKVFDTDDEVLGERKITVIYER
ncbi:MAG: helix-hairpin-helix domain-containing protein [bacterium]